MVDSNINFTCVSAFDIDGDGDIDLQGANVSDNNFCWWENTGISDSDWIKHPVGGGMTEPMCVYGVDIDGDEDGDVLGVAMYEDSVALWINTNGSGTSWTKHIVGAGGGQFVTSLDFDGDGDNDIIGTDGFVVNWYSNDDGTGTSWTTHKIIEHDEATFMTVSPADIDGDGDLDIVYAAVFRKLTWCENVDGSGTSWVEHEIGSSTTGTNAAAVGDFDGDGTMDIVAGFVWHDNVKWWANVSGDGTEWTRYDVGELNIPYTFCSHDMDGDGAQDIVGAGNSAAQWWKPVWEPLWGNLTSSIIGVEGLVAWQEINWSAQFPLGSSVSFLVRSSSDSTEMGAWSDTLNLPGSLVGLLGDNERYMQYKVLFQRINSSVIPILESITVKYSSGEVELSQDAYRLYSVSPNPCAGTANISFDLPLQGHTELVLYDMSGRIIRTLLNETIQRGTHELSVENLQPGFYIVRMEAGFFDATEALVVIEAGD